MKRRDIALAAALLPFASIFAGSTAFAAEPGISRNSVSGSLPARQPKFSNKSCRWLKPKASTFRSLNSKTTFSPMRPRFG